MESVAKQFVVQEHRRGDDVHWDMMFEGEELLVTFRLPLPPEKIAAAPVIVEKILDHDLKFLTYEGPVNKGLGAVRIVDKGIHEIIEHDGTMIRLRMEGKILCGEFTLKCIEQDRWRFLKAIAKE